MVCLYSSISSKNRHRWLHHITDETPVSHPPTVYKWSAEHSENLTLQKDKKYIPYSTTRPKIEPWEPPKLRSLPIHTQPRTEHRRRHMSIKKIQKYRMEYNQYQIVESVFRELQRSLQRPK
ncbi:unnamed protein product [Schistosoma bovis]|nr:unnamed protein product [Schistosoma bovis]